MGSAGGGGLGRLRLPERCSVRPRRLGQEATAWPKRPRGRSNCRSRLVSQSVLFCEFFAGEGVLTSAMMAAGVPVRPPEDLAGGGTDFEDKAAVDVLRREFEQLAASGVKCMVHLAPPCSTFSRACGRSILTRLRSTEFPQGIPRWAEYARSANLIARNTLDFAEWLARD